MVVACLSLFTQCKPHDDIDDIETLNYKRTSIYGEIMVPKSRITIDGTGVLTWESSDCFYYFNNFSNNPLVFKVSAVFHNTPHIRGFASYNLVTTGADYIARDIYYVASTISSRDIIKDISVQSGKLSDLKNYLMAKASIVAKKSETSGFYQFPETPLNMKVAIVHIDLPEMDCDGYYFDYEGCINTYKISKGSKTTIQYWDDTTKMIDTMKDNVTFELGKVCVNNSTKNSYVVLFSQQEPIPNTVLHIYADEEEIASIVFPNGIRANKLYVGEDGGAIKINERSVVAEEDLFVMEQ